jgi:hypothetical protein
MTITHSWNIIEMSVSSDLEGETDVITRLQWVRTASDGTHRVSVYRGRGIIDFEPVSHEHFVPFDQFTKEMIDEWLDQKFPIELRNEMDAELDELIGDFYRPKLVRTELPWKDSPLEAPSAN